MKLLTVDVTAKCNLGCSYCYVDKKSNDMSLPSIKKILEDGRKHGFTHLGVSGGEPLLRSDLMDILRLASGLGYLIKLNTNGTLVTNEFANAIKGLVSEVQVTIDGDKETHNALRSDSYDAVIRGLRILIKSGIKTCVATVLSKDTYYSIPRALSECVRLGVTNYRVIRLIPHRSELRSKVMTPLMNESLIKYFKSLNLSKPEIFYEELYLSDCGAGKTQLGVNPDGSIVPCIFYQEKVGRSIGRALASVELAAITNKHCRGCKALAHYCGLNDDPRTGGVLCRS